MAELNEQRLELAKSIQNALARENFLTSSQARSFVRCLQSSWEVDVIRWSEKDSALQLSSAYNLIHVASIFDDLEGAGSTNSALCYKRAAEQLEWLARSGDPLNAHKPIMLIAGAAYQLCGLPAMATGLLKQFKSEVLGWELYSLFLRGDFDAVVKNTVKFWEDNPELTQSSHESGILNSYRADSLSWYIAVEIVRILGLISYSLRTDNRSRLKSGLAKLNALQRLAIRSFDSDLSVLLTMLNDVANSFENASIYNSINQLSEIDLTKSDRLKSLARRQFFGGRGILWKSQIAGVERLVAHSSFALCTPTGSGKTLVANLALIKELLLVNSGEIVPPLAIYLVPSRALASEVEKKLADEMGAEFTITGLYSGNDWGDNDYWLDTDRPSVLVATVEKAEALFKFLGVIIISRLKLIIIDEAHQVVPSDPDYASTKFANHRERSIRLESFVSRILLQSPDVSRIALTAVAGGAATPVAQWIESSTEATPVGGNYRSTRQVIGVFETRSGISPKLELNFINGASLTVADRENSPYLNLRTTPMPLPSTAVRSSLNKYNQLEILWSSFYFRSSGRRILISLMQMPEQTMKWYCEAIDLDEWSDFASFELPENDQDREHFEETLATCIDYCGEGSYEARLLKNGIATSHGQMPHKLRLLMVNLIEKGICSITLATATLTEGVNLPFDIIFLPQLKRGSYDVVQRKQVIIPLSVSEFRNLSGRAGRPGASNSMEGLTLIGIPQVPPASSASKKSLQQTQIQSLKSQYQNLTSQLVAEEESGNDTESPIALLLEVLFHEAMSQGLVNDEDSYLEWLDRISPGEISELAATGDSSESAQLADILDELDLILLNAVEEIQQGYEKEVSASDLEKKLTELWKNTFSYYAAAQEEWMERAFIKRGSAILQTIYSDSVERKRLYNYGFTPFLGKRFNLVFSEIKTKLLEAENYGALSEEERNEIFIGLAQTVSEDSGYGFYARDAVKAQNVLQNWRNVLSWWLGFSSASSPIASELREWQRFVSDNLEFRLGVAVGAVVAASWSDGSDDPLSVPSIDEWKETTNMPWFGFWARELLRWGTHDPFIAFSLTKGLAKTRELALEAKSIFTAWLREEVENATAEDLIDPRLFIKWQSTLPNEESSHRQDIAFEAILTGMDENFGEYDVTPIHNEGVVKWLDPAGYELANSQVDSWGYDQWLYKSDFKMMVKTGSVIVTRVFS
jgi:hypothetical protein